MYEDYMASLAARGRGESTLRTDREQLKLFYQWADDNERDLRPEDITSMDAVEYRDWLQEQGKMPATINKALQAISAYCAWLCEEGRLDHNPLARVSKVQEVQTAPKWLDKNEKYSLIRAAFKEKDIRNTAIIFTLLLAGLRATELIELTPDDVTLGERKGAILIRKGKGNKRRTVPIPKELRECFEEYLP